MRISHPSHRWNHSTASCRQCGCYVSEQAALEACAAAVAKPKPASAPTQESMNRALATIAERGKP